MVRVRNDIVMKRLIAQEDLERAERGCLPAMRSIDRDEIPFGIRAIEQGIKVEGIWVSRRNTPLQSPGSSRPPSIHNNVTLPTDTMVNIESRDKEDSATVFRRANQLPQPPHMDYGVDAVKETQGVGSEELNIHTLASHPRTKSQHGDSRRERETVNQSIPSGQRDSPDSLDIAEDDQMQSWCQGSNSPTMTHPSANRHTRNFSQPRTSSDARTVSSGSFYTSTTLKVNEAPLYSLDAHRLRQAEVGQLGSRSIDAASVAGPSGVHAQRSNQRTDFVPDHLTTPIEKPSIVPDPRLLGIHPALWHPAQASEGLFVEERHAGSGEHSMPPTSCEILHNQIGRTGTSHVNTTTRRVNSGFEVLPYGTLESTRSPREWGNSDSNGNSRMSGESRRKRLHKRRVSQNTQ